jgi:magnesium chelatase family protein
MGYAQLRSVALRGAVGQLIVVEADVAPGLPSVVVSGLPDAALTESRDRVRAAVVNSGQRWPQQRITVNLLPAHLPKHGSGYDFAIAISVLAAAGAVPTDWLADTVLIGELGLDGALRPIRGVLPSVLAAAHAGIRYAVVPLANAGEAQLVSGITVHASDCLGRFINYLHGLECLLDPPEPKPSIPAITLDLADVLGQDRGRRGVEVAAAGEHHLALVGPPGSGKTMLAQRLPTVLPPLDDEGALEVTALHSIAGVLPAQSQLIRQPPFQAPHHTATVAALVGGGSGLAQPGAITLAHRGVLFIDEAPELSRAALNALRQPLEDGEVRLRRAGGETVYPARVQLVLAANPCPCAKPAGDKHCECSSVVRRRYIGRLSGPLMDRVDLQVKLDPVRSFTLLDETGSEPSTVVAKRVVEARAVAAARWSAYGARSNATVPSIVLRRMPFRLPKYVLQSATTAMDRGQLSARGHDRVLRVAWTMADLDGRDRPDTGDVNEALEMRAGIEA